MATEPKRPDSNAEFVPPVPAPRDHMQEAIYNPINPDELKYFKMYPGQFADYRDILFDDEYFVTASKIIKAIRAKIKGKNLLTEAEQMVVRNFGSNHDSVSKLAKHMAAEAQSIQREKLIRGLGRDYGLQEFTS